MNNKFDLLMQTYEDTRGELKQRITQRDNFAVQYIVASMALMTLACEAEQTKTAMLALVLFPIITLFYSAMIESSYRVHDRLVEYLNELENQLTDNTDITLWEQHCKRLRGLELDRSRGSRRTIFQFISVIAPIVSCVMACSLNAITASFVIILLGCLLASIFMLFRWRYHPQYTKLNKLAFCDYERNEMLTDEPQKAILFDRDGTLHVDKVMTHKLRDLELLPGAKELVKQAHDKGYKVIVVTNQSAIGKGYYSIFRMHLFNAKLRRKLKYIDAIYYCPHTKEANCRCRKPDTGMIERAKLHYNLDLEKCIMVGDRMSDIQSASNAGIPRRIFVTTGIYKTTYKDEPHFNDIAHETVSSLSDIAQL